MERYDNFDRPAQTGCVDVSSFTWSVNLKNISRPKPSAYFNSDGEEFCLWIRLRNEDILVWLERMDDSEKLVISSFQIDHLLDGDVAETICSKKNATFFPTQRCLGGEHLVMAVLPKDKLGQDGFINLQVTLKVKVESGDDKKEKEGHVAEFVGAVENGVFNDFILKCEDQEVPVCRFLLAAISPVFLAMFSEKNSEEGKPGHAVIDDVDLKSLQALVKVNVSLDEDDLTTDLMAAATKYKISDIVEQCEEHLSKTMSVDNAIDYFLLAIQNEAKTLQTKAFKFITEHLSEVKKTEAFLNLEKEELVMFFEYFCQKN